MKDDAIYLLHIKESIRRIEENTSNGYGHFTGSHTIQDAVLRNLQTIAESTQRLSEEIKAKHPEIEWQRIAAFRNVLVHDYLGVDLSCMKIETPDTALVPNSGPTVASRTTMIMGSVLEKCAQGLKKQLFDFAAGHLGVDVSDLRFEGDSLVGGNRRLVSVESLVKSYLAERGPLTVIDQYTLPPGIKWDEASYKGDAYPAFSWGCDVAEVMVDLDTFEVRVERMWLAYDIGRAINPKLAEGQIEGGTLQALGYATMEHMVAEGGHFKSNRLQTYTIPTALDAPEMETAIVEKPFPHGPMGAKGLGEIPMNAGARAIANAIAHAIGIRVDGLPITPERIYQAWRLREQAKDKRDG